MANNGSSPLEPALFFVLNLAALGANWLCHTLVIQSLGTPPIPASVAAWLAGALVAFALNRLLVFPHESAGVLSVVREAVVFLASRIEIDCVGWACVWALADVGTIPKMVAVVVCEALVLTANYFVDKYVVFAPTDPERVRRVGLPRHLSDCLQAVIMFVGVGCLCTWSITSVMISVVCRPDSTHFGFEQMLPVIVGLVVWLALAVLLRSINMLPSRRIVAWIAFFTGFALSALWVFIASCGPAYDAWDLSAASFAMFGPENVPYEYRHWVTAGYNAWGLGTEEADKALVYMGRFPYQVPFVLLLHACQMVAGNNFALFYQLINALANGVTFYLICLIAFELSKSRLATFLALGILALSVPLIGYSTFIYGNILSHPFVMAAWYACLVGMRKDVTTTRRIVLFCVAGVLLGVSSLVKSTMTIASIAFVVTLVLFAGRYRAPWALPIAVVPFVLSSLAMSVMLPAMEGQMQANLHQPLPRATWIVMGLGGGQELALDQTGEESTLDHRRPGYYDGYVWSTPSENGFASWDEQNAYYLNRRLDRFAKDPAYLIDFMSKKLATEWLDATGECFDISDYESTEPSAILASRHRDRTRLAPAFYEGPLHELLVLAAELDQALVAVGSLAWCVHLFRNRRRVGSLYLFGIIFFLGSALLYAFWENKSQYLLPAWMIVIPYAACGWNVLANKVASIRGRESRA